MARRANRKDANHAAIAQLLRQIGAHVIDAAAAAPVLGFDLLVVYRGQTYIMEVKDGSKPPSERQLTPNEQEQQAALTRHGVMYHVVLSEDDALKVIGAIDE
jgi:hypothetical protein